MPQVNVPQWMVQKIEVAVKRRQHDDPGFKKSNWAREAFAEKLKRELGGGED